RVTGLESFTDADAATARITAIYDEGVARIRRAFHRADPGSGAADGRYPFVGISVGVANLETDARLSYGVLLDPGFYGTTLTRPDALGDYYREQIRLLLENHRVPVVVGIRDRIIPLPFVVPGHPHDLTAAPLRAP